MSVNQEFPVAAAGMLLALRVIRRLDQLSVEVDTQRRSGCYRPTWGWRKADDTLGVSHFDTLKEQADLLDVVDAENQQLEPRVVRHILHIAADVRGLPEACMLDAPSPGGRREHHEPIPSVVRKSFHPQPSGSCIGHDYAREGWAERYFGVAEAGDRLRRQISAVTTSVKRKGGRHDR